MNLSQLIQAVIDWANARNLIQGSDPKTQTLKTMSEFGEIAEGLREGVVATIMDGIGDTLVTCIIVASQLGIDVKRLVEEAASHTPAPDGMGVLWVYTDAAACLGYMADNIAKGQTQTYSSNLVVMVQMLDSLAFEYKKTLCECLAGSYAEIKDRKGVMYHGTFIKESDDRYASVLAELGTAHHLTADSAKAESDTAAEVAG